MRIAALALLLLGAAPAQAEWREAETPHFKIRADLSEAQLTRFAERLEAVDSLLRLATATNDKLPPVKVRIFLLESQEDVLRAYGGSNKDIAGFYTVNAHGPLAVSPRRLGPDSAGDADVILFHEYAHHFMLQYLPAVYPSWVVEGFAELASTAQPMGNGKIAWGKAASHRGYSLTSARWIAVPTLMSSQWEELPKNTDFYGQSWLMAHYLILSGKRPGQLTKYLGLLRNGVDRPEAARQAFGDLTALNRELRIYLEQASFPYRAVPIAKTSASRIRIRPLSAAEADLVLETASFSDHMRKSRRPAYLQGLRAKVAKHPRDPFALQLLADAEFVAEDYKASRAAVDQLLAVAPDHRPGMLRKAMLILKEAEDAETASAQRAKATEARKLIVAANKADPEDPQPLIAYYQSFRVTGEAVPNVAIEGLMQALGTIPQDSGVRMMLVEALASKKRFTEAAHYLEPIAYDPHPSEDTKSAMEFLAKLREQANGKKGS